MIDFARLGAVLGEATVQTLLMVALSTIFSVILGVPLGILLCTSDPSGGLKPCKLLNQILSVIINILRAIPFVILVILLFPFTRVIVGTAIGTKASIVPLTIAAAPFVARVIESSLKEQNKTVDDWLKEQGEEYNQTFSTIDQFIEYLINILALIYI